jgi:glutaminase
MASSSLPVWQYLEQLHARHKENRSGQLANYIPELARVDPDQFGIAFATMDGYVYEVGDTAALFTIQSVSKAMIYGLALEDHGREAVLQRIGVEPSGEAFNAIRFDEVRNRPFNPMVNAGAIAATALVKGADHGERNARILEFFRRFTGRDLALDEDVYRSESATGHRNRAIAYLELNSGMIEGDVDTHLDLYFRQCSLLVNTVDLALIGATLANGGVNPVTGERAMASDNVRAVLSVMNTCGMYDYAGGWQFDVGLPAKSGVGGGIAAALPGQLGIGTFSPRLDAVGNSARGVQVCQDVSTYFRLHLFSDRGVGATPIRRVYRATEVRSKRVRRPAELTALDNEGHAIAVCELQGELSFIETEWVSRRLLNEFSGMRYLVLDMTRLRRVDSIAIELLLVTQHALVQQGVIMAVVANDERIARRIATLIFPTVDDALEHFEDELLVEMVRRNAPDGEVVPLKEFALLEDWAAADIEVLEQFLDGRSFEAGDRLIVSDALADALYFLSLGRVDVRVPVGNGEHRRLSTIDAGNVFGELAIFGQDRRTADIVAATPGRLMELGTARLDALRRDHPGIHASLTFAVGRSLAERLRRANREIQALAR